MPSISRALIFALLAVTMPVAARAQTTSTLLGVVRDTSGAVIPGVTITVKHLRTNASRTVVRISSSVTSSGGSRTRGSHHAAALAAASISAITILCMLNIASVAARARRGSGSDTSS